MAHNEEGAPKRLWSNNVINFFDDNLRGIQDTHDDAVTVSTTITKGYLLIMEALSMYCSTIHLLG